jgi:hypothetical protein
VTDKQYKQHLNKLDKTKEHNDTWQERLAYVLSCEKKDLDKDDIKMLNNIWREYGEN